MKALAKSRTRLLARFGGSVRGATGMVLRCQHSLPRPFPPHPPTMGTWPNGGKPESAGGGAIGFFYYGVWRVSRKPVEIVVTTTVCHVAVRTHPPRVALQNPRVALFLPRVVSIFPRVCFLDFTSACLSISFFSLRKERDRGVCTVKQAIHGFENSFNTHSTGRGFNPRVFRGLKNRQKRASMRVCGRFDLDPRIHGLKCLYPGRKGS